MTGLKAGRFVFKAIQLPIRAAFSRFKGTSKAGFFAPNDQSAGFYARMWVKYISSVSVFRNRSLSFLMHSL